MTLRAALELRRRLEERTGCSYPVMRSARRSRGVSPFFVCRVRRRRPDGWRWSNYRLSRSTKVGRSDALTSGAMNILG